MTKSELRKLYLAKRQALLKAELETASALISANFFRDFDLSRVRALHCFIAIERFNEVDTRPIFQRIWGDFPSIQTVVPRVDHEIEEIQSLNYGPDTEIVHNRWRIGEPTHNEQVDPIEIDMVLIPLLCFDKSGHRVGYGKGYYDRFLRRCRTDCQKIGLSIFEAVDEITDIHEGDATLNFAITPTATTPFGS